MLSLPPDQLEIEKFIRFQLNRPGFFDAYNATYKAHMDYTFKRLVCDQRSDNECKTNLKSAANNRKELNPASKGFWLKMWRGLIGKKFLNVFQVSTAFPDR